MTNISKAFFWRRFHSLVGCFLVIFLLEHLITNSQAALFFGDDGSGFVRMVNIIHSLPYLPAIEIFLLGVPFLIHMVWGVVYLRTGKLNSMPSSGNKPSLGEYPRNHAYSWQRITSWILLFGIIFHVYQMRFEQYPLSASNGTTKDYMVRLSVDEGLYTVAKRLDVAIYDAHKIFELEKSVTNNKNLSMSEEIKSRALSFPRQTHYNPSREKSLVMQQEREQKLHWIKTLGSQKLKEGEVIAVSESFGTATLLVVRDTFKSPFMVGIYTIFVLAACFHAFNGLWTFMITWGITLTPKSQELMRKATTSLTLLITFLGLAAVWGTYWINLRY